MDGQLDGAADDQAEHGDLILEAGGSQLVEVAEFSGGEAAGVEAVLEGVEVSGLGTAAALRWVVVIII